MALILFLGNYTREVCWVYLSEDGVTNPFPFTVPEFHKFIGDVAHGDDADIFGKYWLFLFFFQCYDTMYTGARLVGRWKSGARILYLRLIPVTEPSCGIVGAPLLGPSGNTFKDPIPPNTDPEGSKDPNINNFDFSEDLEGDVCPFSAHIRSEN